MATAAPLPVQCNASNPSYVTYRNWARALAEREDQTTGTTRPRRDAQIRIEFQRLGQSAPTVARLAELINDLNDYPELDNEIEEIADRDIQPSRAGTELAYFNTLTGIAPDIRDHQERIDIWQEIEDILGTVDLTRAQTAIRDSHFLARVELGALVDKEAYGRQCLDSLRLLQRDAPREDMSVPPPTYDAMKARFKGLMQKDEETNGWQPLPGPLLGSNLLFTGVNGTGYVYIRNDANGLLADRIVRKEVSHDEIEVDNQILWRDGDFQSQEAPQEAWTHFLAGSCHPANNNIVAYRNWALDWKTVEKGSVSEGNPVDDTDYTVFKIYIAYCPQGSLRQTIEAHAELVRATATEAEEPSVMLPENFIWSVFSGLAAAACVLRYGRHPGWGEKWDRHIIHTDVKPDNVFLSMPRSDGRFPGYPNTELGDFGLALDTAEDFVWDNNPAGMVDWGTKAWSAPEQKEYDGDNSPLGHAYGSYSDVFSIGLTILALMNCADSPRGKEDAKFQEDQWPPKDGFRYRNDIADPFDNELALYPLCFARAIRKYSGNLRQLALLCTEADPARRPDVDDLYLRIRSFVRDPVYNEEPGGTSIEWAQASDMVLTEGSELEKTFAVP